MRGLTVIIVCFLLYSRRKDDKDRINFSSTSSPSLSIYSTSSPERSDMAADAPSPGNSAPSSPASSSAEPDSTSPQRTTHKDWLHKLDSMSLCGRSAEPLPARKGETHAYEIVTYLLRIKYTGNLTYFRLDGLKYFLPSVLCGNNLGSGYRPVKIRI